METRIEFATLDDLISIQQLNLLLFQKEQVEYDSRWNTNRTFGEIGTQYFKDSIIDENACTLVARHQDKVVGYLVGWTIKNKNHCRNISKQAELENMFILEEFRSEGIGGKLVNNFLDWAKEKGVENIRVSASAANQKAINFYHKCGFKDYDLTLEIDL